MYTDEEEDRALTRLLADLHATDRPTCHTTRAGLWFTLALVCALGALGLLLTL